jgi:hypothetical protein
VVCFKTSWAALSSFLLSAISARALSIYASRGIGIAEAVVEWAKTKTNKNMNICLLNLIFSPTLNTMPYRPLVKTDLKLWEIFHFSCQDE